MHASLCHARCQYVSCGTGIDDEFASPAAFLSLLFITDVTVPGFKISLPLVAGRGEAEIAWLISHVCLTR